MSCCSTGPPTSSEQEKTSLIQGTRSEKMQSGDGFEYAPRKRGFLCTLMDCCADAASPQVWRQFRLMMWRNFLIKRRKFGELIKGWILPVLVFLVIYLLYLEFPEVIGTVKIVQEKVRNFEDDGLYAGIGDADDLFGGGDDDFLFNKIQREVIDISLNSYLEQVGVPIAFLQLQWSLITLVVLERENRVKEMMLMMSLQEPAYWLSMFTTELLSCGVLCVLLGGASAQWGLFHDGGFFDVASLLFCYSLGTISFLYFVSSFFKSAQSAAQLTSMAMVVSILAFVAGSMEELSPLFETLWCLVPPVALQYGILSFFPSNAELGLPICVDTCPDTHTWCSHEKNPVASVCGDQGKWRDRDFCDFDADCCGDGHCDSDTLTYHGCVIMMHKINCVTQAQFDQTTLPLPTVNAMLLFDCLFYAFLTACAIHYDWSLSSGFSCLWRICCCACEWCAGASDRSTKEGYREVVDGSEEAAGNDGEEEDDEEGRGKAAVTASSSSSSSSSSKRAGSLGAHSFHPEGYVEERSSKRHRSTVKVVGLFKTFAGGRMGFSGGNVLGGLFSGRGGGGGWFGLPSEADSEGEDGGEAARRRAQANPKPALNRTCLTLKEGELTVLMGQNGAGKTSLINVLTGRLMADSGRAEVFGHDANNWRGGGGGGGGGGARVGGGGSGGGMPEIRQSLGVCPQEDALFEGFTPREMLEFYAALKGVPTGKPQRKAVHAMLRDMGLLSALESGGRGGAAMGAGSDSSSVSGGGGGLNGDDDSSSNGAPQTGGGSGGGGGGGGVVKRLAKKFSPLGNNKREPANMFVGELSGGQRRRVSIGIALIGDSKLVVLDEPTSAMDPLGKHQVWALLRRMRTKRTILLTTHLMDEADAVADRVAVMAAGRVHCAGSPAFLKRHLGAGYTLTLARQPAPSPAGGGGGAGKIRGGGSSPTLPFPLETASTRPPSSSSSSSSPSSSFPAPSVATLSGTPHPALRSLANWARAKLQSSSSAQTGSSSSSKGGALTRQTRDQIHMTLPFDVPLAAFFRDLEAHLAQRGGGGGGGGTAGYQGLGENDQPGGGGGEGGEEGAMSYGVEMPSLESVFLRVTSQALGLPNPEEQDEILYDDKDDEGDGGTDQKKENSWSGKDLELETKNKKSVVGGNGGEKERNPAATAKATTTTTSVWRQAFALARFRLHIALAGQPLTTLGVVLPSAVASFLACAVLGSMHSLGTEARGAVVAAMMVSGIFLPGITASVLLKERELGLRHLLAVSGCGLKSFWLGTWLSEVVAVQLFPTVTLWVCAHLFSVKGWVYEPWFYAVSLGFAAQQVLFSFALSFAFPSSTSASLFAPGVILVANILLPALAVLGAAWALPGDVSDLGPFSLGGTLAYTVGLCSPHVLAWLGLASLTAPFDTDPPPSAPAAVAMQLTLCLLLAVLVLYLEAGYTRVVSTPGRSGGSSSSSSGGGQTLQDDDDDDDDEDVVAERARAYASASDPTALLRLVALRKEFPKSKTGGAVDGGEDDNGSGGGRNSDSGQGQAAPTCIVRAGECIFGASKSRSGGYAPVSNDEDDDEEEEDDEEQAGLVNKTKTESKNKSKNNVRVAVKDMSLVASRGECVGLLGPNGAGKSTTIAMLSRAVVPTEGDASLCGFSVLRHAPLAFSHLGLVPQDMDTLWATATVDAHVRLFCSLRGVVEENGGSGGNNDRAIASTTTGKNSSAATAAAGAGPEERIGVDRSVLGAVRLGGAHDRAKRAGDLSGGMRRRLSTALALVGSPSVVVLDEPTAGLDPLSRRHVWDALRRTMAHDKLCLLLTTHSLDEAEALCHRLGIVVDGALKCLGSPLHLKTKFGRGYEVAVRISAEEDEDENDDAATSGGGGGAGGGSTDEFGIEEDGDDEYAAGGGSVGRGDSAVGGARATLPSASRVSAAIGTLSLAFPSARVLERHDNRFRLLVPKADMDLPKVFDLLEGICRTPTTRPHHAAAAATSAVSSSSSLSPSSPSMQSFYCVNLSSIEQVFLDVVQGEAAAAGSGAADPNPFTS